MKKLYQMTPDHPTLAVGVTFHADVLFIDNPTSSPVLVRVGSPQIPNFANADYTVPALSAKVLPVNGQEFGLTFLDSLLLTVNASGNVTNICTVLVQTADEPVPNFGAANYQSLSTSELLQGYTTLAGPTTTTTFDIGPWGGALVSLIPSSGSGQGVIDVQTSADGVSFQSFGTWAFWPNIPAILLIPRTVRRFRVVFNATAIPGEPAIAGVYSIRATIAEIQNVAYNAKSASINKAYTVGVGGTSSNVICTVGLPGVSIGLNNATGTRGQLAIYVGQSVSGPWRFVTEREQSLAGVANSIMRSIGQLDLFMDIRVLDTGATGLTGTLTLSIPGIPDQIGALNRIDSKLGDPLQTPNVNQSIYHELDTIRIYTIFNNTSLANIDTYTVFNNTRLANIDFLETTYLPNLVHLFTMNGTMNTYLPNLTNLATIASNTTKGPTTSPNVSAPILLGAGVWQFTGLVFGGIEVIEVWFGGTATCFMQVSNGNVFGPNYTLGGAYILANTSFRIDLRRFGRGTSMNVAPANGSIWLFATAACTGVCGLVV